MATPEAHGSSQTKGWIRATAMPDPSHVCDLHHSSWQRQILNPLSKARDLACILMDTSHIHFHYATMGTPEIIFRGHTLCFKLDALPTLSILKQPFHIVGSLLPPVSGWWNWGIEGERVGSFWPQFSCFLVKVAEKEFIYQTQGLYIFHSRKQPAWGRNHLVPFQTQRWDQVPSLVQTTRMRTGWERMASTWINTKALMHPRTWLRTGNTALASTEAPIYISVLLRKMNQILETKQ